MKLINDHNRDMFKTYIRKNWIMFVTRDFTSIWTIFPWGEISILDYVKLEGNPDILSLVLYRFIIQNKQKYLSYDICYLNVITDTVNIARIFYDISNKKFAMHINTDQLNVPDKIPIYIRWTTLDDIYQTFKEITEENQNPKIWYVMNDSNKLYYEDYVINKEFSFELFIKIHEVLLEEIQRTNNSLTTWLDDLFNIRGPKNFYRE